MHGSNPIEGHKVNCLLDTGSQVTTIPLSFFQTHLSHYSLKSLDDLLDVELQIERANGEKRCLTLGI